MSTKTVRIDLEITPDTCLHCAIQHAIAQWAIRNGGFVSKVLLESALASVAADYLASAPEGHAARVLEAFAGDVEAAIQRLRERGRDDAHTR